MTEDKQSNSKDEQDDVAPDSKDDFADFLPDEVTQGVELGALHFGDLSSTDFEEFCFDLMQACGFQNVDWRKGTPRPSSPADRGRDIVANQERIDVDGHRFVEHWFVDCKHYERGVPPEALQGAVAWATAERPATVLFIASGYLTNAAKDWISDFERTTACLINAWPRR